MGGSMMDYASLLLQAINNYSEENMASKNHLRDLVCVISDNTECKHDLLIKKLLFIASQKMRVFGYNIQNGFKEDPDENANILTIVKNEAVKQNYRSRVRPSNILDMTQKEIIDFFENLPVKRMLVSAPTSYGKTFLMREILFLNRERYNNVILVFPTVALLRENATEMESFCRELHLDYRVIKSISGDIDISKKNIFVFTPERTIQLIAAYPNMVIDFFFYDEVYKIDDDYCYDENDEKLDEDNKVSLSYHNGKRKTFLDEARAKTFRISLYLLSMRVHEYYLAGPNLSKDNFGSGMREYLQRNNISVKEIKFEPTKRILVNAYSKKIEEDVSDMPFVRPPMPAILSTRVNDRICDVIHYISENDYGKTMLYCTTPAKANEYATKLAQNNQSKTKTNEPLVDFMQHLTKTYDVNNSISEWSFIKVLEKGYALHHGKLPKYIQKEMLEQFNHGDISILFCTSTIVEGVNTKASNMVILNHTKGRENLTPFDLKNIIGRAGRYYHNFIGRIFLADKVLVDILNLNDMTLNFATYDDAQLDGIDLDNAELSDLKKLNREAKLERIEQHKKYKLPEEVFYQNRLIKIEVQEDLLNFLLDDSNSFNGFYKIIGFGDILTSFTDYNALGNILRIFMSASLIDDYTYKKYNAVGLSYCKKGFRGILEYEIGNARNPKAKNKVTIDQAYSNAFVTLKETVEHKIPQLLSLFESIFICAAKMKKKTVSGFSLSRVVRYYETGVKSYFGEQLIEFGFPLDAIRKIENDNSSLMLLNSQESKMYFHTHQTKILSLLDEYEKGLIYRAIDSIS